MNTWSKYCEKKVEQYEREQKQLVEKLAETQHKLDCYRAGNPPSKKEK